MSEYRVAYVIDVDAENHRAAAEAAAEIMAQAAYRGHYRVQERTAGDYQTFLGAVVEVDLETNEEHEPHPGSVATREREDGLYTLAGLKDRRPNAHEAALQKLDATLWQDEHHTESIHEVIVAAFATKIGEPVWAAGEHGQADYPGVPGVELNGWDLGRGEHVALRGRLDRDNAPALPWHDWVEHVTLGATRYGTSIDVHESDQAPYAGPGKVHADLTPVLDAMDTAVQDAVNEALSAAKKEAEHVAGEEYLTELSEANGWLFDEDGNLA